MLSVFCFLCVVFLWIHWFCFLFFVLIYSFGLGFVSDLLLLWCDLVVFFFCGIVVFFV